MPSLVPLNNAIAQNAVDFNNQTPINAASLFRYKINLHSTNSWTFNTGDLNSVCIFNGSIADVLLTTFSSTPPIGAEIIFYSTTGVVRLSTGGGVTLNYSNGTFTQAYRAAGKIIHIGSNEWFFASANTTPPSYSWLDCCGNISTLNYISTQFSIDNVQRYYTDASANTPFNGTVAVPDGEMFAYYRIINGYWDGSSPYGECTTYEYNTLYTFYTGPDPVYDYIQVYSEASIPLTSPADLAGYKFFNTPVDVQFDCSQASMIAPGTSETFYFDWETYPNQPIIFKDGYVINIDTYL